MYKKVLMAIDATPETEKTAEHVAEMVKNGLIGRLTLVHAVLEPNERKPRWPGEFGVEVETVRPVTLETRFAVEGKLAHVLDIFEAEGVAVDLQILVGKPEEVILHLTADGGYDLVITGSRGLNHLEGVLMGSVSSKILAQAGCPVMVFNPVPRDLAPPRAPEFYEL
ncbi:MAG: universal stress protein [Firmicutes bacterium]|nr:universal stress protein [Bacillota bacterium]